MKMMYRSNFRKFPTFSMCNNQLVINQPTENHPTKTTQPTKNKPIKKNKIAANDGQLKLTIHFLNVNTGNKNC